MSDTLAALATAAPRATPEAGARGSASAASALGTYTHNSSTAGHGRHWFALRDRAPRKVDRTDARQRQASRDDARAERWALRRGMRKLVAAKRVRSCGRPGVREDGSVVLRITDATGTAAASSTGASGRVAGYAGLFRCGNVWLCPECSVRIAAARAAEIEQLLAHFLARGGWAVLVTLTMRHHRQHTLEDCLRAFSEGWTKTTSGGAWQADKVVTGLAGWCRALEVTESPENGWHVHAHAVLVFRSRPSEALIDAMAEGMFSRWSRAVQRAGMPAPLREYGLDVQRLDPTTAPTRLAEQSRAWAAYVSKGIAQEAALGATKEAKGTNRTVRQLMRSAIVPQRWEDPATGAIVESVDLSARARLAEYEQAISGRKQLTWSRGIRAEVELGDEREDQEVVDEELTGEDVAVIPQDDWRTVEPRATELLSVAEQDGADAARRWLSELGVDWQMPNGLTDHRRHGERPAARAGTR